ncbi:MAG: hypothetical protein ACPG19_02085 [Saprospiraceae bacterium]
MKEQLYNKIEILIQRKKVYLVNKLDETIEQLAYSTFSMVTTDNQVGVSDAPNYQIQNIPAGHAIYLETLDGWEDGVIYYDLVSLKTASISINKGFSLKQKPLSGLIPLPPLANCSVEKISSQKGFIVNTNGKKAINELYWLAEELKAYTDLVGGHFDTEKAQTKLWKMNSILSKNDFPKVQALQNNLLGRLEIPMFFEKDEFSKKIDELYELLEKMK